MGLNSDLSVKRLKGLERPLNSQQSRIAVLQACRFVDEVILFDEDTPAKLIEQLRPDVIVKGGDYLNSEVVGSNLAEVVIFPTIEGYSTTSILERFEREHT